MSYPLLCEINTRCWLRELSARLNQTVRLGNVPEAECETWRRLGFTHLWLMGVWTVGPRSRAFALNHPGLRANYDHDLPDWKPADVAGSPYAIAAYTVPRSLGGEVGLKKFRRQLARHGLSLLLDFVPNHVGLDHEWAIARPRLFVQNATEIPEAQIRETSDGRRWIAYGKDPNFPAWADTLQLDHRNPDTRAALIAELKSIAQRCDGVRCDMAMLALNDVFARTWQAVPRNGGGTPESEFWEETMTAVRASLPRFCFVAEAYWGLEARLQALGFNFTYDKALYDLLLHQQPGSVQAHLREASLAFVQGSVHFLENHDEARIASRLSLPAHRGAALVTLGLPGMRLLHDGQWRGARLHTAIQLERRPAEPEQPQIAAVYEHLLATLQRTSVGRGRAEILQPRDAWEGNATAQNFVVIQWQDQPPKFDLVVVNLASQRGQCYVALSVPELNRFNWRMTDRLGEETYLRDGDDLQRQGLYLDLPPHGAQLFHFEPAA